MLDTQMPAVTISDIQQAARRLVGKAVATPLLRSPVLDAQCGGTVFIKPETLQRTGSFKFRGAFNRISQIPDADRARGVVACSSGNHAQGVAQAARLFGVSATIVMPADAPVSKTKRTQALGARVVAYERGSEDRIAIANRISGETGATFIHPFDDPGVIAGQGTVGLEIADALAAADVVPDAVLVPCGGGGLTAGVGTAVKARFGGAHIHTVEPAEFDDHARSFLSGERCENARRTGSVADALLSETPGLVTFAINRVNVTSGLVVSEDEILQAVAFAARELKLVVEPGGAVALAAVLNGHVDTAGKTVVIVLSGGNIDDEMMTRALTASASP